MVHSKALVSVTAKSTNFHLFNTCTCRYSTLEQMYVYVCTYMYVLHVFMLLCMGFGSLRAVPDMQSLITRECRRGALLFANANS